MVWRASEGPSFCEQPSWNSGASNGAMMPVQRPGYTCTIVAALISSALDDSTIDGWQSDGNVHLRDAEGGDILVPKAGLNKETARSCAKDGSVWVPTMETAIVRVMNAGLGRDGRFEPTDPESRRTFAPLTLLTGRPTLMTALVFDRVSVPAVVAVGAGSNVGGPAGKTPAAFHAYGVLNIIDSAQIERVFVVRDGRNNPSLPAGWTWSDPEGNLTAGDENSGTMKVSSSVLEASEAVIGWAP